MANVKPLWIADSTTIIGVWYFDGTTAANPAQITAVVATTIHILGHEI